MLGAMYVCRSYQEVYITLVAVVVVHVIFEMPTFFYIMYVSLDVVRNTNIFMWSSRPSLFLSFFIVFKQGYEYERGKSLMFVYRPSVRQRNNEKSVCFTF